MAYSIPGLSRGRNGTQNINKRIPTTGTPVLAVHAQGTLTIAEPVTAEDTIVLGAITYTFKADGTAVAEYEIDMGADEAATKLAIVAAINGTDSLNVPHPFISAAAFSGDDCVLTAKHHGTDGNALASTEGLTHASNVFDATTLGTTIAGVDGVIGEAGEVLINDTHLYVCMLTGSATVASIWREVAHSALS